MTSKNFVTLVAIAPRRRLVASAIVYGLSLAVRFTSATGEEVEIPAAGPVMSIMNRDRPPLPYADWSPNAVEPIFLRHRLPRPIASMQSCFPP